MLQELLNQIQAGELSDRQGSCNHDSLKVLVQQTCQLEFDMMQAVYRQPVTSVIAARQVLQKPCVPYVLCPGAPEASYSIAAELRTTPDSCR